MATRRSSSTPSRSSAQPSSRAFEDILLQARQIADRAGSFGQTVTTPLDVGHEHSGFSAGSNLGPQKISMEPAQFDRLMSAMIDDGNSVARHIHVMKAQVTQALVGSNSVSEAVWKSAQTYFPQLHADLTGTLGQAVGAIPTLVATVNSLIAQVSDLNSQVLGLTSQLLQATRAQELAQAERDSALLSATQKQTQVLVAQSGLAGARSL
jgi:phage I-like protein